MEDTDWENSEFSHYDLGQAVAHVTLQAQVFGLSVRQFRAFNRDGMAAEFTVPAHWEVTTMAAVGRAARTSAVSPRFSLAEAPPRQRRAVTNTVWPV